MSAKRVLIVGSGVAGMRAAYDLAAAGIETTLLEPRTYTGGTVMQLEKQFPTDACGICRMQPRVNPFQQAEFCLRKDFFFPGVEVLRDTAIDKIEGGENDVKLVSLRIKGLRVDPELCIGCEKCTEVCPIDIQDDFSAGINRRKAIDKASPHAIISLYTIDDENCDRCGECAKICPTNAITIGDDEVEKREFDAVLLAPGFEEFIPAEMTEYGYGIFPDVVTSIELERLYAPMGPNFGQIRRPSDGKIPRKIAFIQCVGSRMEERPYCSSACCMYSMKEARHIKDILPDSDVKIFFMDVRAFGKDYYRYERDTEEMGIEFIRCRVPKVYQSDDGDALEIVYENDDGERVCERFDMVVLSIAQVVTQSVKTLAKSAGVETDKWGFAKLKKPNSHETTADGVYVAGSFVEPKDIADAVSEASAAAGEIIAQIGAPNEKSGKIKSLRGNPPENGTIGVILCKCAGIISDAIDLSAVEDSIRNRRGVTKIAQIDSLCTKDGIAQLKKLISDGNYRSIIISACQPNTYLARFADACETATENPPEVRIVDARRTLWTVRPELIQDFITSQLGIEIAAATHGRKREILYQPPEPISPHKRVIIIGAGIAGLSAAEFFADIGIPATVIEKSDKIGGVNRDGTGKMGNSTTGEYIANLVQKLQNSDVEFITSAEVKSIDGGVGAFKAIVGTGDDERAINGGAVIVATGAFAYETEKFCLKKSPKVMLWNDFERDVVAKGDAPDSVVFIQCADSRNENRPWCNRICCIKTMELAHKLIAENPKTQIWVLNRDIVTYGLHEIEYEKAREAGVFFIKYSPQREPKVDVEGEDVIVKIYDSLLKDEILIRPDYVVLQTGIVPSGDSAMSEIITKTDGFWDGFDTKFSPHETSYSGIFVAGSGRAPMRAAEAIVDGKAAAAQALKYIVPQQLNQRNRIAYVRERICVGCKYCISACPYEARTYDYITHKVSVLSELCQGCGACAVACPSEATVILGDDKNRAFAQIMEAVK